jgi:long-chain acyl-CoA synthetase
MTFYDRLVNETQEGRKALYSVPQLVDGLQGHISRETYIAYLTEAYHHVKHTVPFLMAMGSRIPEQRAWLRPAIADYIREEIGHEKWILNDIAAAGGNKEAARFSKPSHATEMMVAYNYDYIARKNPVGFFGMVFMLESTSTQIATQGATALKKGLNLPENAFTYLFSHGNLDKEHMEFFKKTINLLADTADQEAVIEVARNSFILFANLMRNIPHKNHKENLHAA